MSLKEILSERIRTLRIKKNIKQSELGEIVGLTYTAVSDIERGRRTTTLEKLEALADYFDIDDKTDFIAFRISS
ncbi:helix-turn-helix domain-containing protein [Lutispora saccharofermentans]|uniref:Helix-turn-helix transcriptional regulator n=1 Tax=Lutispora saccharofermentans TaxID=3024236 RepID=A0ABT1NHR4_9FIRM|nr:helix-turn-helix transcriptional regulator [Lutispora saccharofermentans]MCQ1530726.1 helix-turn-helix transcriptional regulator [Lutispora saccharofermentans]